MATKKIRFDALLAQQGSDVKVAMIRATAAQIHEIALIDRLGRDESGASVGFQRPQVAKHINEIRDYLERTDAVLPNALVLAFVGHARVLDRRGNHAVLEIEVGKTPPGFVVDGQQRLSALTLTGREDFEVFASCLLCEDLSELRRQFILINNTKPLAKSHIYELVPSVNQLPERYDSRHLATQLIERLNFSGGSTLHRQIKMQTHPKGVLRDTALHKAIINSESAGAIQVLMNDSDGIDKVETLLSNFFGAVQTVFPDDWRGHKPATSRLIHGAGVIAMGFVMDEIFAREHDISIKSFVDGLQPLVGRTAWTKGRWHFADDEVVPWDHIEHTPRQVMQLSTHLVSLLRQTQRKQGPGSKRTASRKSQ